LSKVKTALKLIDKIEENIQVVRSGKISNQNINNELLLLARNWLLDLKDLIQHGGGDLF
jgi:hypothetical protein